MSPRIAIALGGTLMVLAFSRAAWADPADRDFPDTLKGETVRLEGVDLGDAAGKSIVVTLKRTGSEDAAGRSLRGEVGADGATLTFKVPGDGAFPQGLYRVSTKERDSVKELPVHGDLRVLPDAAARLGLDSIAPSTAYLRDGRYALELIGENLPRAPEDAVVLMDGQTPPVVGTPTECGASPPPVDKLCLSYKPGFETRVLHVEGFGAQAGHVENVRVQARGTVSNAQPVVFADMSPGRARVIAAVASALLGIVILCIVRCGVVLMSKPASKGRRVDRVAGGGWLTAFFLDKETNTYSLSKFQVLAWTAVFVFGYLYLLVCYLMIQCNYCFPDIPSNLPLLLGVSAGTTVLATAITSRRGCKGAGTIDPSLSDFITTGGLVAGDRFQFFVWTLIACGGFVALLLKPDPSSLRALPDIPPGLLLLMGVSATGYLGGKIVRSPGPVFRQVEVTDARDPTRMTLTVRGDNLSKNGSLKIDGVALAPYQYAIDAGVPEDRASAPALCSSLVVTLKEGSGYREGLHWLILTNDQDGQMAECRFPWNPLSIRAEQTFTIGAGSHRVKGENFSESMTCTWRGVEIDPKRITRSSDTEFAIELDPGELGGGTLTLTSKLGLTARATVTVIASDKKSAGSSIAATATPPAIATNPPEASAPIASPQAPDADAGQTQAA